MAVFTKVTVDDFAPWLRRHFALSLESEMIPISEGIENTNYKFFANDNPYVFTIFEIWQMPQVEYYVRLMQHLANHKTPVPMPVSAAAFWESKPGLVIPFIQGTWLKNPNAEECQKMGEVVAGLHLAVSDFEPLIENPRNAEWRRLANEKVRPMLSAEECDILDEEMTRDGSCLGLPLPAGACHCDLFRNNVLWLDNKVSAVIDFYFGGNDTLIFDLAVCACDWCFDGESFDHAKLKQFISGYTARRKLCDLEKEQLANAFCIAALRFWLSRLFDIHFPRRAEVIIPHNPEHFKKILLAARKLSLHNLLDG